MKNNLNLFLFKRITKSEQSKIKGGNTSIQDWVCATQGDLLETENLPSGCQ